MGLYNTTSIGSVSVASSGSSTATATYVNSTATSTSLLSSNSSRKGATILNNSTANLFVELGSTASLTAYTVKINSGGYYEVPFNYVGEISGIWDTVNGKALIRELT